MLVVLHAAPRSGILAALDRIDGQLRAIEEAAGRRDNELAAIRHDLDRLERRVALLDRRAPDRGHTAGDEAHLDALAGSVSHLAVRLDLVEARRNGARDGGRSGSDRRAPRRLTFLTSITPADLDRQERAVRSWLEYGDVVSLNGAKERKAIRAAVEGRRRSPLAEVMYGKVAKTAAKEVGKPCVYVDDMLDFVEEHGADDRAFLIVNSDVVVDLDGLVDERRLSAVLGDLLEVGPVFGSRVEVGGDDLAPVETDLTLADGTYVWGFDYFFLTGEQVAPLSRHRFVFGQPWWDYFLPHELLLRHGRLFHLENRVALHVHHPVRWNHANFERMERRFAKYLAATGQAMRGTPDPQDTCREIRGRATRMWLPAPV